jgi:hypothetical protein
MRPSRSLPTARRPPCPAQDFEALTPNLLARTMETVEGGGIIVLLISSLDSLSKLYTMSMDVHARFRTESHQQARAAPCVAARARAGGADASACAHPCARPAQPTRNCAGDGALQRALHLVAGAQPQLHLHGRRAQHPAAVHARARAGCAAAGRRGGPGRRWRRGAARAAHHAAGRAAGGTAAGVLPLAGPGQGGDHLYGRNQRKDAALHGGAHSGPRPRQGAPRARAAPHRALRR